MPAFAADSDSKDDDTFVRVADLIRGRLTYPSLSGLGNLAEKLREEGEKF